MRGKTISVLSLALILPACAEPAGPVQTEDFIITRDRVNERVGFAVLQHFRQRLETRFCFTSRFGITVVDDGRLTSNRDAITRDHLRTGIVMSWLFDSRTGFDDDPTIAEDDKVAYYLRPESDNHGLAHELGHAWLRNFIITGRSNERLSYGTVASDWFDEAVAIQFETDHELAERRAEFQVAFAGEEIYEMQSFLTGRHPSLFDKEQHVFITADSGTTNKRVPTDLEDTLFYGQALVFTDYLVARSGNPCILMELATPSEDDLVRSLHRLAGGGDDAFADIQADFFNWIRRTN